MSSEKDRKEFFIKKLLENVPKKEKKRVLIDCIDHTGFIKKEEIVLPEPDFDFEQFNVPEQNYYSPSVFNEFELRSGVNESVSSVQGTRIHGNARLSKIQNYIISNEEIEIKNVSDVMENILNGLHVEKSVKEPLNMYIYIKKNSAAFDLPEPKASLKEGYIIMCIYYTLIKSMYVDPLVLKDVSGYTTANLTLADNYMKIIFENKLEQNTQELSLCKMKSFLLQQYNYETVNEIHNVIKVLQSKEIFNKPALKKEVAAAIYYVINKKNGKIKMKNSNYLNYKNIKEYCGVTDDTVKKTVDVIVVNYH
jgi:hypothetical protein